MTAVAAITRREIQSYFVSPIAYGFAIAFLLITSTGFNLGVVRYSVLPPIALEQGGMTIRTFLISNSLVQWANFAMIFCLPGLSMRLFTEERKNGTAELLFTSPITTLDLVLGKFLGALSVHAVILAATAPLIAFLAYKTRLEWGAVLCAYVGMLLYGAFLLSIGALASTLTENQFIALVLTWLFFLPFLVLESVAPFLPGGLPDFAKGLSVGYALQHTSLGLIDTHNVLLYLVLSGVFLFLSVRVLDSSRWR